MKILYLLFGVINSKKLITNIDLPSCRNCVHFNPSWTSMDFTSSLTKCNKFGNKNIITDEITYDYADLCRDNEEKCGKEGKYYEKDNNINLKIIKHKLISNWYFYPFLLYFILLLKKIDS